MERSAEYQTMLDNPMAGDVKYLVRHSEAARGRANKLHSALAELRMAARGVLSLSADIYAIGVSNSNRATSSEWDLRRVQDGIREAITAAEAALEEA